MRRLTRLYSSTVGKKVVMALTGVVLVLFVLAHMAGNLKAFQGAEAFNTYAEGIRQVGTPFLPHRGALWTMRVVLLAAAGLHVWAAYQLYRKSDDARSVGYRFRRPLAAGLSLLLFVGFIFVPVFVLAGWIS